MQHPETRFLLFSRKFVLFQQLTIILQHNNKLNDSTYILWRSAAKLTYNQTDFA